MALLTVAIAVGIQLITRDAIALGVVVIISAITVTITAWWVRQEETHDGNPEW